MAFPVETTTLIDAISMNRGRSNVRLESIVFPNVEADEEFQIVQERPRPE
jgi:hypothetical protein|tara:strand:- start:181 stop:330 length:150 start_codon:yes stop_codon:yes gene_type:complete